MASVHGRIASFAVADAGAVSRDLSIYTSSTDFPLEVETADDTAYGDADRSFIPGLKNGTMSASGNYDSTVTTGPDVVLFGIRAIVTTYTYGPEGSTSGKVRYTGSCILTSYSISAPVGDKVAWSAEFQLTGPVTRGTFP